VRALDLVLVPSWEEPFGRVVLEALALRVPVIATDVGGPREIITEGREGLLRPPRSPEAWAQAIRALADDAGARERMGRLGRARVQEAFTLQQHAAALVEIYEHAAARSGAPPSASRSSRGTRS